MRLCLTPLTEGVFRRRLGDGAGCGARAQVSHTWTREAFGTPLGRHYERPARSWLTSDRDQKWPDEKRGPRTEIAAVERREARRSWTGDLRRNGDRPDREAGHLGAAAIRTSAVSALRPPRLSRGNYRKPRSACARENAVGCLKFESGREPQQSSPACGRG